MDQQNTDSDVDQMIDDFPDESVSMRSGNQHSGMSTGADDGMGGELTIIEKRRRLLECFSDMMAYSINDMENYFAELEDFLTLSDNDKRELFHSSMLEILLLKCFWTYSNGEFVHPETREVIVNRESLMLATNDINFVESFMGLFHTMETMGFKEKEVCLLICISMFDVGRTDIQALDDREGIQRRQDDYVRQLIEEVPPEHHSETLLMRTTLKELKISYMALLARTESNRSVDMGEQVYAFMERLRNPAARASSSVARGGTEME